MSEKRRFILSHHRSPGDIVCLTALARDIHLTYPGEFEVDVDTTVMPAWDNNPYLTRLWNRNKKNPVFQHKNIKMLKCQYGRGIRDQSKETIHFCAYFHRDFKKQTGISVPVHYPHGDLHLSAEEKATPPVLGRYWLIMSGGKSDFTIKVWHKNYFQEVTDRLGEMGLGVVQSGAEHRGHWHPKLEGDHVIDLVGHGGFREWLQQIYHADGIICGVTGAMHIAAALHKPCVVIGGGREAWWWEAYVNENKGFGPKASGKHPMPHRYLHTIGLLDCCKYKGCWKNKVVPLGNDKLVCKQPVMTPEMPVAKCMQMITPSHVMEAVMSYYTDKSLPPIDPDNPQAAVTAAQPAETVEAAEAPTSNTLVPKTKTCKSTKCQSGGCSTGKCTTGTDKSRTKTSATVTIPTNMPIKVNPRAKVNVRDPKKQPAVEKPGTSPDFSDARILDHPTVGGKITACILFYGGEEYHDLHKKCLTSFLATTPAEKIDLRVGSNALNKKSLDMIQDYQDKGFITKHYRHDENAYKYPVMREMFFDPECPITTKWVLWFDDDSICDVEPSWLNILARHISQHHKGNEAHMIGATYIWTPNRKQKEVLESRPWHKGRPWRTQNGSPSPNGNKILFATGGFWAITHEAIVAADIPDLGTGLTHTGGDWQIGEQLYQSGYTLRQFNGRKQFVRTSSVDRRGATMPTIDKVDNTQENGTETSDNVDNVIVPPPLVPQVPAATVNRPVKMQTRKNIPKQPKLRKI